jgi:hypothetical protein
MRFDIENQFSVAQAFTGAATVSTNSYQKQTAAQDLSIGRRMAVVVFFTAAGAGTTHTLEAIQADNAALTSNVEVLATVSITTTALLANPGLGYPVEIPIPQGVMTKQFLGFRHTATSGTTTATIDAYLMPQDEVVKYKSFPKVVDADVV